MEIRLFDKQMAFFKETAKTACWIGGRGCGKAQPVDEPVLTPLGWVPIGSLRNGDRVIGSDGKPHNVVGIFPQGEKLVYKVTFNDGTWTRACGEHLWKVNKPGWNSDTKRGKPYSRPWRILDTEYLFRAMARGRGWVLPDQPVVDFEPSEELVNPWLLGFLIGDGCFRVASGSPGFSTVDDEILDRIKSMLPVSYRGRCDYSIVDGGKLGRLLNRMGLMGKYSQEKHIPDWVFRLPSCRRWEFVRGLMDADGSIQKTGRAYLATSSEKLANDFADLTRSLGCVSRISRKEKRGYRNKKTGEFVRCLPSYEITINSPENPFWLERKREKWRPRTKYKQHKAIRSIEEDGTAECVCIAVDAEDHLYITRDYTPTHNTFTLALWVLDQCMRYPGVRGIVGSSSNPQLRQATIPDFIDVFDQIGIGYDFSEWNGTLQFGNGSRFKFQSFDVPEDRVKGGNIGFFAVDEIDACPEGHIRKINLAVRHPIGSRQRRFIGNSPPPGHWLEKWFIPEVAKKHGKVVRGPLHQASLFDNYLLPADFVEEVLKDNPPGSIEYRRHVMGELRVPQEGAVYKEFDADQHVIKYSDVPWSRLVGSVNSLDLGNNHWTVFLKGVLSDDDVLYVIDEFATRRDYLDYIAEGVKGKWWSWVDEENDPGTIYSDHDAQDRMELARLGVETVPAIKGDIVRGISAVKERFRDNKIKIVGDNCPHLISEIPNYVWAGDDSKPGKDEPVDKFNDALDALRYMVNGLDDEPDLIESAIMNSEEDYGYSSP